MIASLEEVTMTPNGRWFPRLGGAPVAAIRHPARPGREARQQHDGEHRH